jgi:adenylate cyclase
MAAWKRGLIGTLALLALAQILGFHEGLNRWLTDTHWRWRAARDAAPFPSDIVVVAIDDRSVHQLGRLKYWSRQRYADLVDRLPRAKAVGFDILFSEPDVLDPKGDAALARAMQAHGRVVVPFYQWKEARSFSSESAKETEALRKRLPPPNPPLVGQVEPVNPETLEPPLPPLLQAAGAVGYADVNADPDGVYRDPTLLKATREGTPLPHFTVALAALATGTPQADALQGAPAQLRFGNRSVPTDSGSVPLQPIARRGGGYFKSVGRPVPTVSFVDALKAPPEQFDGKIVLVGETATGTTDIRPNPLDNGLRGVELNAEILANLLHLQSPRPLAPGLEWLLVILAVGLPLWLFSVQTPLRASVWTGAAFLAAAALLEGAFWAGHLLPSWSPVLLGFLGSTLTMGVQRAAEEHAHKQQVREKFSMYVPPKLVEQIVQNPERAAEQGTRERVAVLFSDVRGFTTYSEQNEPELVVRQMREYLDEMTVSVDAADGVLDKFIGDAVMALYGPLLVEEINVSARAVESALDMLRRLDEINAAWAEEGLPLFRIGIGIHVGDAIVGNIGTPRRTQFTALGDTVNLAARLESSTKDLKVSLVVSEAVLEEAGPELKGIAEFIDRGAITVKGREQAVRVFEVRPIRKEAAQEVATHAPTQEGLQAAAG